MFLNQQVNKYFTKFFFNFFKMLCFKSIITKYIINFSAIAFI